MDRFINIHEVRRGPARGEIMTACGSAFYTYSQHVRGADVTRRKMATQVKAGSF